MVDIEFIRKKHFIEGWSIRKIARNLGISRQSVREKLASSEIPRYRLTVPRPCPVMDPYKDLIMAWLEADKKTPPKQRHTAKRIYDRLVEEYGFTGGESTVRHFVRKLKGPKEEVYILLTADWGEQAQVDWGRPWRGSPARKGGCIFSALGCERARYLTSCLSLLRRWRPS